MRLSAEETEAILSVIELFLPAGAKVKVLVFGSRTDDSLRGGDIDLALVFHDQEIANQLKLVDYQMLSAVKANPVIGDQKIDPKIISEAEADQAFYRHALKNAVEIHKR